MRTKDTLCLFLAGIGLALSAAAVSAKSLTVLLVVAPHEYLESEYEETRQALEVAGIKVDVASDSMRIATGYGAGRIQPDLVIAQAKPDKYDAIAVIGGRGAQKYLWDNKDLHVLLRKAHDQGRIIAAICAAPPVLANAGLLKGLNATMWPSKPWIAVLEAGGAHYVEDSVVVSGRIITGKNPFAAPAFGRELAAQVKRKNM